MLHRMYRLYGAGEGWTRPVHRPHVLRADGALAVVAAAAALVSVETARSLGTLDTRSLGELGTYGWVVLPVLTLVLRRALPVVTFSLALVHYLVTAMAVPELSPVFVLQVYYFFALFSFVAWTAHRRAAVIATLAMAVASLAWVTGDLLLRDQWELLDALPRLGRLSPPVAALLQVAVSTLTFLLASSLGGVTTWWSARREAQARERGVTIAEQAERLRSRSLAEERLRVARELHDAVGQHVALIGIQTGAARAVLRTAPHDAAEAMRQAEDTSRAATRDLRLLLNALRVRPDEEGSVVPRSDLTCLPELWSRHEAVGLRVDHESSGCADDVPAAVSRSAYRVVQEALTNVCRHSLATRASVDVRVSAAPRGGGTVSVRVADPGPPRGETSGSRLGLVGMQERVELHDGSLEAASTPDGGFAVLAQLTWGDPVGLR